MATCGNCKQEGMSVDHVRDCFAAARGGTLVFVEPKPLEGFSKQYVESRDFKPMALTVPDSHYAIEREAGFSFYEVRTGKSPKWNGIQFVDLLVGAPGQWRRLPVKAAAKHAVLAEIGKDPKAAAIAYSREFTVCAVCGSPLSDPESISMGLGPVCARRF